MTLYKNVDICDLESIMKNGILSINECGNNNWDEGKRSDNDTSVVYLFKPTTEINTFPNYGIVLLEVDCGATENKMSDNDIHKDDYVEYVTKEVKPNQIRKVIIPNIFKERITLPKSIEVTWCNIYSDECVGYDHEKDCTIYKKISDDKLKLFADTTPLNTTDFNFFRGIDEKKHMIDLYNVKYIWK